MPFVLLGKNISFSVIVIAGAALAGFMIGSMVGAISAPAAAKFVMEGGSVDTRTLDRYYAIRNGITCFSAWTGLIVAQVTFVLSQLQQREQRAVVGE